MKITRVRIFPFSTGEPGNRVRAYAEIECDDTLIIRGIRIIESRNGGLFLGYPSYRARDGQYREYIRITDSAFKKEIRETVIDAFHHYEADPEVYLKEKRDEQHPDEP